MVEIIFIFVALANAQVPQGSRPAFNVPSRGIATDETPSVAAESPGEKFITRKAHSRKAATRTIENFEDSNTLVIKPRTVAGSSATPFVEFKGTKEKFKGLIRSTILKARINDSITAYVSSKDPVKATVTEGTYKGSTLFGNATMDKVTKNVIVAFDTFIPAGTDDTFKFLATIKDQDGNSGLVGVLESHYWETFFLQFALLSASTAANTSAEYSQNKFGDYAAAPTTDSAVRHGVAGGFNKMSDKIEKDSQEKQEFTTVQGPVYIRVYVLEQPEQN